MLIQRLCIALIISGFSCLLNGQQIVIDTSEYLPDFYYGALEYNLIIASSKGYDDEVKRLISRGADIDTETSTGATPLFFAISNDHLSVVNILLSSGADPNKLTNTRETPLILASRRNNIEIAESLIRNGGDINHQDMYGATALHYAAIYNYVTLTDLLLYYEAEIDIKSDEGTTPLMAAVWAGNIEIADMLIRNGANLEARDRNGFTPFLIAAQNGDTVLMDIFLDNGVDLYEKNAYNWDALSLTIRSDQEGAAEFLLNRGNKWNDPERATASPYDIAAVYRRKEILEILRRSGLPGGYKRQLSILDISLSSKFTLKDYYSGFGVSFREPLSNLGLTAGFDTKPSYTKVLTERSENVYYQYMDKSSFVYLGILKDFALTDKLIGSNFSITASICAGYFFGEKFKGTATGPEGKVKIVPSATIKWIIKRFTLFTGAEFMNSDFYKIGPVWCRTGCSFSFQFNNIKAPIKTIRWY
jgi:ankyrin repeat protein